MLEGQDKPSAEERLGVMQLLNNLQVVSTSEAGLEHDRAEGGSTLFQEAQPVREGSVGASTSRQSLDLPEAEEEVQPSGLAHLSQPEGTLLDRVRQGMSRDTNARNLMALAKEGKTRRFWLDEGLLYTRGRRIYVPRWEHLRQDIIRECHDTKWAGHPGQRRTIALLERNYYWPKMREEVESYVRTCLVCQQDKTEQRVPAGLLEPLPIPERPWESVSLDFIAALPASEGLGSIMVVVDRFSKYATFIPTPRDCSAEQAARLFFRHVIKYWGVPKTMVSDRDPRFTAKLWAELFRMLGTELRYSTSFHPQTDGQTERVNALLEMYLRHFVSANQRDWARLMDVAQFSYNLQRSESTGKSPFEIVLGQQPATPLSLESTYTGSSPLAFRVAKDWGEQADVARSHLNRAAKRMKKWADQKRRVLEFRNGDMVMLKLIPQQFRSFRRLHKGLLRRYEGPFRVIKKIGKVSYRLDLPPRLKIHPVFHVSMLKPYEADENNPDRGLSSRAPMPTSSRDHGIECIVADRVVRRRGEPPRTEYLVKWKGLSDTELTWENAEILEQDQALIDDFNNAGSTRASTE